MVSESVRPPKCRRLFSAVIAIPYCTKLSAITLLVMGSVSKRTPSQSNMTNPISNSFNSHHTLPGGSSFAALAIIPDGFVLSVLWGGVYLYILGPNRPTPGQHRCTPPALCSLRVCNNDSLIYEGAFRKPSVWGYALEAAM